MIHRKTLTTMYTSFIRPGLEYGSIVFCNCTHTEDEILESVQRRAFKIITGGIARTPTNNLYDEIGMETLKVRRDRNVLLFFFKIIHNMVPSYLQELKPEKQKPGRYMFRTKNDFVEQEWRLTKYRKSFLPFATRQTLDVPLPLSTKRICHIVVDPRDISFILRRTPDVSRRSNIVAFNYTRYIKS